MECEPSVGLLISSRALSGAEKRFVRIFLAGIQHGFRYGLFINKALGALIRECDEFQKRFEEPHVRERIFEFPDLPDSSGRVFLLPAICFRISKMLRRERVELVHAAINFPISAILACLGHRVVFEVTSPDVAIRFSDWRRRVWVSRLACISTVSPGVDRLLRETLGANSPAVQRIVESPLPFFQPAGPPFESEEGKQNIIVFACRLIARKNPTMFARVARQFLSMRRDWKIWIFGSGPEERAVKEILAEEIHRRVVTVRQVPSVLPYLGMSRICVSLIEGDNYPSQTVLEAMSMGNALLLSNRGDSHRFINGDNGRLVELSEKAILDELMNLTSDVQNLDRMGMASKALLNDRFGSQHYFRYLRALYQRSLNFRVR